MKIETPWQIRNIQDVTATRALDTEYTNNTGKTIFVNISVEINAPLGSSRYCIATSPLTKTVAVCGVSPSANILVFASLSFLVKPGNLYKITNSGAGGSTTLTSWIESN